MTDVYRYRDPFSQQEVVVTEAMLAHQARPAPGAGAPWLELAGLEEAYMPDDVFPYTAATSLAFPDTRLTSERLWVSSALSVLRARHASYVVTDPLYEAYGRAVFHLGCLEALLREEDADANVP